MGERTSLHGSLSDPFEFRQVVFIFKSFVPVGTEIRRGRREEERQKKARKCGREGGREGGRETFVFFRSHFSGPSE